MSAVNQRYSRAVSVVGVGVLLALPWVFGLQITSPGSYIGPGFSATDTPHAQTSVQIAPFGGGVVIPTYEGPRPFGGHARVLLGGDWRRFLNRNHDLGTKIAQVTIDEQIPLVMQMGSDVVTIHFLERGWDAVQASQTVSRPGVPYFYTYMAYHPEDAPEPLVRVYDIYHETLFNADLMAQLETELATDRVLLVLATEGDMQRMLNLRPDLPLTVINRQALIVDFPAFVDTLSPLP